MLPALKLLTLNKLENGSNTKKTPYNIETQLAKSELTNISEKFTDK